jgi:hypothetical protein
VVALDAAKYGEGNHTVELRGLNDQGVASLPVFVTFAGGGEGHDGTGGLSDELVVLAVVLVVVLLAVAAFGGRIDPPKSLFMVEGSSDGEGVLDAELIEGETPSSSKATKT